jgi:hypothetical protein
MCSFRSVSTPYAAPIGPTVALIPIPGFPQPRATKLTKANQGVLAVSCC